MPTTPIASWGTAIVASLAGALAMIFAAVPKILAFLVIVANAVGGLVRGAAAEGGIGNPDLLGRVARAGVLVFAIVVAVNQVGIAQTLVNALFMGLVFAFSLALGLSFGLGGRETAGQIVPGWYQRGRESAPRSRPAAAGAVSER